MPRDLLTETKISKGAKPKEKEYLLGDGDGLFLRVRPTGAKDWLFKYKSSTGIKKIGLGSYPDRTLASAREEANRLRQQRTEGVDPVEAREEERTRQEAEMLERVKLEQQAALVMTMDELFESWDSSHGVTLDTHWRAVRRSHWRCHITPVLGHQKIDIAEKQPMLQRYDQMVREGKEETARRVLALLKQVVAWGIERQYVADDHPLGRLVLPKKQRSVRSDQLPENFDIQQYLTARGEEAVGNDLEDSLAGRALQFSELVTLLSDLLPKSTQALTGKHLMCLMLATGIRSSEAVRLRWQWIDIERRLMIIPAGSMKKRKMHHIHLSEYAIRQLDAMQAIRTGDFVFPAPRKENDHILRTNVGNDISSRQFYRAPDESNAKFEARLAKRMQCRRAKQDYDLYNLPGGKWTLYDLRRTVATRMEELGVERDIVARVLAHARPDAKTTGRYARHTHWEQRCKTLDLLGSALELCANGQLSLVDGGNVVQLKRA